MNVTKIGNAITNSKFLKGISTKQVGEAAATIALISTTTKDALNCGYYTYQSLNNKKIPEEKRKFVAGIDLSNGILNVVSQASLGLIIKNKLPKMFERVFYNSNLNKTAYGLAKNGFVLVGTLVFAQVILKRILTPFIATPMAHYFKEYADKKAKANASAEAKKETEELAKPQNSEEKTETKPVEKPQEVKQAEPVKAETKKDEAPSQGSNLNIISAPASPTFKSFEGFMNK